VSAKKRSFKMEKLARIYDAEVLPVWAQRFGRMLLRDLVIPEKGMVLDVGCGTGYPAVDILRKMPDGGRLIAIDESSAMLDVARKKIEELGYKGVFFRTESAEPKLSFADDVYDVVVCNLGVSEMDNPGAAIADFARVTTPGGEVRVTLPLAGTFQEFYDIYREVLIKHDKHEAIDRLNDHIERHPSVEDCEQWLNQARLDKARVDVEEFTMLFKSSREFFFAPVIEFGQLSTWKAIAGSGQDMQDVFWYIKEAIDAYFGGRAFQVTVKAGALYGTKPMEEDEVVTGRVELVDLAEAEAEELETQEGNTSEIDLNDLEDIHDLIESEQDISELSQGAVEIEAFHDDVERPSHLRPVSSPALDPNGGMSDLGMFEEAAEQAGHPSVGDTTGILSEEDLIQDELDDDGDEPTGPH